MKLLIMINKNKMKNIILILGVMITMTSCYSSHQFVGTGGNHLGHPRHKNKPVRRGDVRVIESAHGRYGGFFFYKERPCHEQW